MNFNKYVHKPTEIEAAIADMNTTISLKDNSTLNLRKGDALIKEGDSYYVCPRERFNELYDSKK